MVPPTEDPSNVTVTQAQAQAGIEVEEEAGGERQDCNECTGSAVPINLMLFYLNAPSGMYYSALMHGNGLPIRAEDGSVAPQKEIGAEEVCKKGGPIVFNASASYYDVDPTPLFLKMVQATPHPMGGVFKEGFNPTVLRGVEFFRSLPAMEVIKPGSAAHKVPPVMTTFQDLLNSGHEVVGDLMPDGAYAHFGVTLHNPMFPYGILAAVVENLNVTYDDGKVEFILDEAPDTKDVPYAHTTFGHCYRVFVQAQENDVCVLGQRLFWGVDCLLNELTVALCSEYDRTSIVINHSVDFYTGELFKILYDDACYAPNLSYYQEEYELRVREIARLREEVTIREMALAKTQANAREKEKAEDAERAKVMLEEDINALEAYAQTFPSLNLSGETPPRAPVTPSPSDNRVKSETGRTKGRRGKGKVVAHFG